MKINTIVIVAMAPVLPTSSQDTKANELGPEVLRDQSRIWNGYSRGEEMQLTRQFPPISSASSHSNLSTGVFQPSLDLACREKYDHVGS